MKGGGFYYMEGLKIMMFDEGSDHKIRYRFISEWFRIDSSMSAKEQILSEIERNCPDVVLLDPDLYNKIDVIETAKKIRSQFDIPVSYAC
jgi:two-component SAPR family response regulator